MYADANAIETSIEKGNLHGVLTLRLRLRNIKTNTKTNKCHNNVTHICIS